MKNRRGLPFDQKRISKFHGKSGNCFAAMNFIQRIETSPTAEILTKDAVEAYRDGIHEEFVSHGVIAAFIST